MRLQEDIFDKQFVYRIAMMIESRLICYKHYYYWAEEIITSLEKPPNWVLEIASITYYRKAVKVMTQCAS